MRERDKGKRSSHKVDLWPRVPDDEDMQSLLLSRRPVLSCFVLLLLSPPPPPLRRLPPHSWLSNIPIASSFIAAQRKWKDRVNPRSVGLLNVREACERPQSEESRSRSKASVSTAALAEEPTEDPVTPYWRL